MKIKVYNIEWLDSNNELPNEVVFTDMENIEDLDAFIYETLVNHYNTEIDSFDKIEL